MPKKNPVLAAIYMRGQNISLSYIIENETSANREIRNAGERISSTRTSNTFYTIANRKNCSLSK